MEPTGNEYLIASTVAETSSAYAGSLAFDNQRVTQDTVSAQRAA